mgnify:CR=1 FL=1
MKNLMYAFVIMFFGVTMLQSCDRNVNDEWRVMVDTNPTPVYFVVKDAEGNNLLDKNFEENILDSELTITVNEQETMGVLITEVVPDGYNPGLYLGSVKVDDAEIPCLETNFQAFRTLCGGRYRVPPLPSRYVYLKRADISDYRQRAGLCEGYFPKKYL